MTRKKSECGELRECEAELCYCYRIVSGSGVRGSRIFDAGSKRDTQQLKLLCEAASSRRAMGTSCPSVRSRTEKKARCAARHAAPPYRHCMMASEQGDSVHAMTAAAEVEVAEAEVEPQRKTGRLVRDGHK